MAATFTAFARFKAMDKMTRPLRKMGRASKTFATKMEVAMARVDRRIRRVTKSFGKFGLILGAGLLIGVVSNVTRTFADFEQANANLSSVMATATGPQLDALQKDAKRLGGTTAKTATEVVGLQESFARLGFGTDQILNMTKATISGSIAMRGELADTAELVGAMVKSFDAFESVNAPGIIDQMTAATQQSALNFEKLQTGLPIVAGAANAAGIEFTTLLASMGKLSDAGLDASMSSTALRNIFLEAAKRGVPYQKLLDKVAGSTDQLAMANKLFGKRAAVAAVILSKNKKAIDQLDKSLQGAAGTAESAAAKQLDTLKGSVTLLKSAWEGFILSVEDGKGQIGSALKTIIRTATEMLQMASGTAKAESEMTKAELRIRKLAEKGFKFLKVLKAITIAFVAMKVFVLILKAITAAQMILNIVMSLNPIGLIIIGVVALIALVAIITKKWDKWGAAISLFMGPLGILIAMVMSFKKHWEEIKASFKEGGMLKGIITIGKVLLDAILYPVQKLLELIGKIPGMKIATKGSESIEGFRNKLFEHEQSLLPKKELESSKTTEAKENIAREERIMKQSATLSINNNTENDISVDAPDSFPIKLSATN